MTQQWKPGDVIVSPRRGALFVVEVTANSRAAWGEGIHAVDRDGNGVELKHLRDLRPLVVLDPENREQVEALSQALTTAGVQWNVGNRPVAEALRLLVTPPRPAEPTGLGAVVESDEGSVWVRTDTTASLRWIRSAFGTRHSWSDIPTPLRVLSEGVTP